MKIVQMVYDSLKVSPAVSVTVGKTVNVELICNAGLFGRRIQSQNINIHLPSDDGVFFMGGVVVLRSMALRQGFLSGAGYNCASRCEENIQTFHTIMRFNTQ